MAKILVVEDDAANMKLAVFLLQNAGYSVLSAPDAEIGLTLARKEHPDLILMDIQLPGATDFILKPIGRADLSERARNALLFAKAASADARPGPSA
jgi:two-component system cell cycle response regulator DivK